MAERALVGRAAELERLGRWLDRLARGAGAVVVIEGEAGIGKTRLVEELLAESSRRKLRTLYGACRELEYDLPLAPVADALTALMDPADPEHAALVARLRGEPPTDESEGEHRVRTLHGAIEIIERLTESMGTVFVVEDLHWADRSTLVLIERLAERCRHRPLLVVLTARPYPAPAALDSLLATLQDLESESFELGPLDEDEVRALVEVSTGATPAENLLRAIAGAAGNPLFVTEVLAVLGREDALVTTDGVIDSTLPEGLESLRLAILRRLTFLPDSCLDPLRTAALLGSEFDVGELATVADMHASELAAVLDPALKANVLRDSGPRLAFTHDLIREAIYNDRPPAIREALHHDAALRLRSAGYPALKVAPHLLRGGAPGPEAIEMLRNAARDCAHRDPSMAFDLLERTVELVPPGDPRVLDVKAEQVHALVWAGRWTEGERLARELGEARGREALSPDVLEAFVQAAALRGFPPSSVVQEVYAAAADASDLDPVERTRILTMAAQAAILDGELRRGDALASEALDTAILAGDQVRRCEALILLSHVAWEQGRARDGLAVARQAVALARTLSPRLAGDVQAPFILLVMHLGLLQRFEEAVAAFTEGMEQAERTNNVWALAQLHQALGINQFFAGSLDAAEGEFEAALSLWEEAESEFWGLVQRAWLGRIAVHRGDLPRARRELEALDRKLPPGTSWSPARNVALAALTRALVRQAEGDREGAFATLEDARVALADSGASLFFLRIGPEHVRVALAVGEPGPAESMTAATEAVAGVVGTPAAQGQALRCRGLLRGEPETLVEAAALHRRGAGRIELAAAAEDAAGALAHAGARTDAVGLLYEALEVWEGARASHDAGRVLGRLRELGERPGKRGARRRSESGWGSLTDSERRVVDLVAEGLTYKQVGERLFISHRTVETHINRVFRKLGIGSRAELAALLIERSAAPASRE